MSAAEKIRFLLTCYHITANSLSDAQLQRQKYFGDHLPTSSLAETVLELDKHPEPANPIHGALQKCYMPSESSSSRGDAPPTPLAEAASGLVGGVISAACTRMFETI